MPGNKVITKEEVLKIVAAKGTTKVLEYDVRETSEPGSVPNWFLGVILLLRDEIQEDEKIVVQDGIIKIVKKTPIDRVVDWFRGLRGHHEEGLAEGEGSMGQEPHEGPESSVRRYNH